MFELKLGEEGEKSSKTPKKQPFYNFHDQPAAMLSVRYYQLRTNGRLETIARMHTVLCVQAQFLLS